MDDWRQGRGVVNETAFPDPQIQSGTFHGDRVQSGRPCRLQEGRVLISSQNHSESDDDVQLHESTCPT